MAKKKRRGERPDGLIQVVIDIGRKADGSRIRKSFYGRTRGEAERKRDEYIARSRASLIADKDVTVSEWVEIVKSTYRTRINPAYLKNDDVHYKRLVDALGYLRVTDIHESDLQKALNAVSGMSRSTIEKYFQTLNRVFERARKNKLIPDNPADGLILPPFVEGTHRALDTWEVEHIICKCFAQMICCLILYSYLSIRATYA